MRLPGFPSHGPFRGTGPRGPLAALLLLLGLAAPPVAAELKGYTQPVAIADNQMVNREPVISDTGLIAWLAHSRNSDLDDGGGSRIFLYHQGQAQPATDGAAWARAGASRPRAFGNRVIWQARRDMQLRSGEEVDFVLREVPDHLRDADFPELPAFFAAIAKTGAARSGDASGSFNLDPSLQKYDGPHSNIYQWAAAYYHNNGGSNDVSRLVEQALSTNSTETVRDSRVYGSAYFDTSPKARRKTVELTELCEWTPEQGTRWITHDFRADMNPAAEGDFTAWQRAKAFPFGWEIMARKGAEHFQITTNFYYDLGPVVSGERLVWYGWDGNDYEIYLWDLATRTTTQITTNAWDDVAPAFSGDIIAWEGYETVEGDIHTHNLKTGVSLRVSKGLDVDINPAVWNGFVVWQGFDGDDFELWIWDSNAEVFDEATKKRLGKVDRLTDNTYDDVNPALRDGMLVWMGYADNWDAEIFALDVATRERRQLTENDYEDKDPQTARGLIVWQADTGKSSEVFLASPDK